MIDVVGQLVLIPFTALRDESTMQTEARSPS